MARTPEAITKQDIRRWLVEVGAWFFTPVNTGRGRMGIPDFICCIGGRFVAIEAKRAKGGRTTYHQEHEIELIQRAGGVALVVSDVHQLKEYFNANQSQ